MTGRAESNTTAAMRALFQPRSIALVGASNDTEKFSGKPLGNLQAAGFSGELYPVNPRGGEICGVTALTEIGQLPRGVDVAMVMVPAALCPDVVRQLGERDVAVAVIAVSGFAELGTDEGSALQEELAAAGRESGVRLVGPNCNGLYDTWSRLPLGYNHTHSLQLKPGKIGLVAHSGALFGGFAPQLEAYGQGVSTFISCGNEVDLELADYAEYILEDDHTAVLALILDGVQDGSRFRRLLRRSEELGKPVVVLKLGNTATGRQAALAHSSRLAGSGAAYTAFLAAEGAVQVPTLESLTIAAALLAGGRRPATGQAIGVSTSGAGSILTADVLDSFSVPMTALRSETVERLAPKAGFAQVMNPFDVGAAGAAAATSTLLDLCADSGAGCLLFYFTPVPTLSWTHSVADGVIAVTERDARFPAVVVSPAPMPDDAHDKLTRAGVPVAASLLDSAAALAALIDLAPVEQTIVQDRQTRGADPVGRACSEAASRQYLAERGIELPEAELVRDADRAVAAAARIGGAVVLKASGTNLLHKSEHDLVALGLESADSVRAEFERLESTGQGLDPDGFEGVLVTAMAPEGVEVVIGVTAEPGLGPMLVVGPGGVFAELIDDVAVSPVPLDSATAQRMCRTGRLGALLAGFRGAPAADVPALAELICRLGDVAAAEADSLVALDLNPVRVLPAGRGVQVLDALVITSAASDNPDPPATNAHERHREE